MHKYKLICITWCSSYQSASKIQDYPKNNIQKRKILCFKLEYALGFMKKHTVLKYLFAESIISG